MWSTNHNLYTDDKPSSWRFCSNLKNPSNGSTSKPLVWEILDKLADDSVSNLQTFKNGFNLLRLEVIS